MALRFKVVQGDRSMVLVTEGLCLRPFHGRIVSEGHYSSQLPDCRQLVQNSSRLIDMTWIVERLSTRRGLFRLRIFPDIARRSLSEAFLAKRRARPHHLSAPQAGEAQSQAES